MKKRLFAFLLLLVAVNLASAQKINLENWVKRNVDSLYKIGVDTALYYHSYCGECVLLEKPTDIRDSTLKNKQCEIGNGWVQIANIIIYQQKGLFFSLTFNCAYPPIKSTLTNGNSVRYFIALIPLLNRRDHYLKTSKKKRKFQLPAVVDGGYENAEIYLKAARQSVYMQEYQKTNKEWRKYFWIDKQTRLLALIESDISK